MLQNYKHRLYVFKVSKLRIAIFIISSISFAVSNAQTTVTTAGGNSTGTQGSVSYSIGQTVYTTTTASNGSVAQGVQQPFEITVISGIDEAKSISLNWSTHPNPVADNLRLKLGDLSELYFDNLYYQLIDISGKMLVNKQITGAEATISMQALVAGNYFLKVFSKPKNGKTTKGLELKTFKIIKK
jgi:hypothetical protein